LAKNQQIARPGIGGWPEGTFAIAIVIAPPLLGARWSSRR
jgi:hypothetical protein